MPRLEPDLFREFTPLLGEGGFIPMLNHAVLPDISRDNWRHYIHCRRALLAGHTV